MHVTEYLRYCPSLVADGNNGSDEHKHNDCAGHTDYHVIDVISVRFSLICCHLIFVLCCVIHSCIFVC